MENIPTVHYNAGDVIFREGDPSNCVFLILGGKVSITKEAGKQPVLLATQGKNTIFGEMTVIDGKRRSATVTAIEDTYCHKCDTVAIINAINKLDRDLRRALQGVVAIIRQNNKELVSAKSKDNDKTQGIQLENDDGTITVQEIQSPEIKQKIQEIENSFIRSLFRVLMAIAFKN